MKHRSFCDKTVHWHVDFVRTGANGSGPVGNYRAVLRCDCRAILRLSKSLHPKCREAELDGQGMMRAWLRPKPARSPRLSKIVVVVPAISPDKAWIFYWRGIMAAQGHVSRL